MNSYLAHDPSLVIEAIGLFINPSTGSNLHLQELIECGGVLTCLDIAGSGKNGQAIQVIIMICNNGRKYKEFICECNGIRMIGDCMSLSKNQSFQDLARQLLTLLGTGNPKYTAQIYKTLISILLSSSPTAQHYAGRALRSILV